MLSKRQSSHVTGDGAFWGLKGNRFSGDGEYLRREILLDLKTQGLSKISPPFFIFTAAFGVKLLTKQQIKKRSFSWVIKVFILTLILTAGISVITETLTKSLSIPVAVFIILVIILIGILTDIIGIAFATCDHKPFISMASKKIKKAKKALRLLQNADIVSNICGDVIGDVCGIVSGAAGVTVAVKLAVDAKSAAEIIYTIAVSSIIAAVTVAGKAAGKSFAIRNNKKIVGSVSYMLSFFLREPKQ